MIVVQAILALARLIPIINRWALIVEGWLSDRRELQSQADLAKAFQKAKDAKDTNDVDRFFGKRD